MVRMQRLLWLAFSLLTAHAKADQFSFTPLGDLPGGSFDSVAYGISADGSVVVGVGEAITGSQAFRWTAETGMVALGSLPGGQNYSNSGSGKSVSSNGEVVVGYAGSSTAQAEAFRWTAEDGMVGLGTLVPGGFRSVAWGVSADGSTVVGYAETLTTNNQAFRWTATDGIVALSGIPPGDSIAYAASADGSVVVGYKQASGNSREAFRWTAQGGPVGLGFLLGDLGSEATAITPDARVIIGTSGGNNGTRAFRATDGGAMVDIGNLGTPNTYPMGISNDGSVIVGTAEGSQAFIWTQDGGISDLQTVLTSFGLDLTGWHLTQARAVSADGRTIAGVGRSSRGMQEAWIATIPEPPTWILSGVALATLVFRILIQKPLYPNACCTASRIFSRPVRATFGAEEEKVPRGKGGEEKVPGTVLTQ